MTELKHLIDNDKGRTMKATVCRELHGQPHVFPDPKRRGGQLLPSSRSPEASH